jgi:choice-of-anchor B domain-containing protein
MKNQSQPKFLDSSFPIHADLSFTRICVGILYFILGIMFSLFGQTLTLKSHLAMPGSFGTDVWGYVDTNSGIEYAIMGDASGAGVTIVDVSDPENPFIAANEPSVPGFDVKVWDHYVYSVNGGSGTGGILNIADPTTPQVVGTFPSSHNIFISETGYMFSEGLGLIIDDLNLDPLNPTPVWNGGGFGHDASVVGNLLYDFHGLTATNIYDISIISNPQLLASIQDPLISYHHSGYPTEDGQYLLICDELASQSQADITVWNISDPGNPSKVDQFADPNAIVHNLYIIGDYAYVSYYTAGFRVFDVSDPANINLVDEYDTSPLSGEMFGGAFGVYPFLPSGHIYINDWDEGLFVFSFSELTPLDGNPAAANPPNGFDLFQNYPNPFNPSTTLSYKVGVNSHVNLAVYNVLGQPVRTLVNETKPAGTHKIVWDGKDDFHNSPGSGVYFYTIRAGEFTRTLKMLMLE